MPIYLFLGGEGGSQNTEFFGLEISLRVEISFRFLFLSVGVIQITGIPTLADNFYWTTCVALNAGFYWVWRWIHFLDIPRSTGVRYCCCEANFIRYFCCKFTFHIFIWLELLTAVCLSVYMSINFYFHNSSQPSRIK